MDARIEAVIQKFAPDTWADPKVLREAIQEAGKILAQIAAEFDPKRYTEDISEALLRAVDVQKSQF